MYNQNGQNGAVNLIHTMAVSVLFLVAAIGYSVYVLFELLGSLVGGSGITEMLNSLMNLGGGYGSASYYALSEISSMMNKVTVFSMLVSLIPAMIIVAGIWLVFAAAKSNQLPGLALPGLTMIRVIVIIQLVCACITIAILEIIFIFAIVGMQSMAGYYGSDSGIVGIFVLIMIIMAAVAAVGIIYYLKLNGVIRRIRETLVTGRPDPGVSLYVEICCYILGGVSALAALMSLAEVSLLTFLANAGLATADICFAILLRQYRGKVEQLIYNPQQFFRTEPARSQMNPVQQQTGAQTGSTEELPYYNDTMVLNGQMMNQGEMQIVRMIRQKTGEKICISKPQFWFGKEAGFVDYCITDNPAISRRHAVVTIRNNECFIKDNRSTNRVFLNGHALEPGVDVKISDGDRVRMGDEEFTVSIG